MEYQMKFYKKLLSVVFAAAIVVTTIIPAKSVHAAPADGTYTLRKGIDVSKWQNLKGLINWAAVKQSGIDYVILKVAGRGGSNKSPEQYGLLYQDPYFDQNYNGAKSAGLKVGVYFFSTAVNTAEAQEEATYTNNIIRNYQLDLPCFFDYEGSDRLAAANPDRNTRTAIASTFCDNILAGGNQTGVYTNRHFFETLLNASELSAKYKIWLANYTMNYYKRDENGNYVYDSNGNKIVVYVPMSLSDVPNQSSYAGNYDFWQYTSSGSVPGIVGDVDLSYWYDNSGIFIRKDHAADELPVYRLYNPYSKEHLYTSDENEARTLLNQGWGRFEGEKWTGVTESSSRKDFPVYRLYNPYSGEHLFTQDPNEANTLPSVGWRYEGICWYSSTDQGTPVYRVYNAGTGEHLFTSDANEVSTLIGRGWSDEGTRWYGVPATN
jgi:GH25 family lysozyme M1 (1,4-beta-N-acetylmuramidase)